jgi:hypothetical protein
MGAFFSAPGEVVRSDCVAHSERFSKITHPTNSHHRTTDAKELRLPSVENDTVTTSPQNRPVARNSIFSAVIFPVPLGYDAVVGL